MGRNIWSLPKFERVPLTHACSGTDPRVSLSLGLVRSVRYPWCLRRYGIYPLTAYGLGARGRGRAASPAERLAESLPASPEPRDLETRRVVNMMCSLKPHPHPHPDAPPADLLVSTLHAAYC